MTSHRRSLVSCEAWLMPAHRCGHRGAPTAVLWSSSCTSELLGASVGRAGPRVTGRCARRADGSAVSAPEMGMGVLPATHVRSCGEPRRVCPAAGIGRWSAAWTAGERCARPAIDVLSASAMRAGWFVPSSRRRRGSLSVTPATGRHQAGAADADSSNRSPSVASKVLALSASTAGGLRNKSAAIAVECDPARSRRTTESHTADAAPPDDMWLVPVADGSDRSRRTPTSGRYATAATTMWPQGCVEAVVPPLGSTRTVVVIGACSSGNSRRRYLWRSSPRSALRC